MSNPSARNPAASLTPVDHVLGAPDARVLVIEYGDFECAFCGRAYGIVKELERKYSTHLRVVFRSFPLAQHRRAQKAAEAAHCAGEQGKFWEMHDRLFANQQTIAAADLPTHAEALQLDASQFQQCPDSGLCAAATKNVVEGGQS